VENCRRVSVDKNVENRISGIMTIDCEFNDNRNFILHLWKKNKFLRKKIFETANFAAR